MMELGWFSTGRGEGSRGLFQTAMDSIQRGELEAHVQFVFCNREPGEDEGSDRFHKLVQEHNIPLITFSSQRFAREQGKRFPEVRLEYDQEAMRRLKEYTPHLCALAGYMLIVGGEMCRRYAMLNLHPALPSGPKGTWQQVVWELIQQRAPESGVMVHLATEEVDQGPPITYCSFPIRGEPFDPYWQELESRSLEKVRQSVGEEYPLFYHIRQEQMRRERPLLMETLKAFAQGRVRVEGRQVVDAMGRVVSSVCLNDEVERALGKG